MCGVLTLILVNLTDGMIVQARAVHKLDRHITVLGALLGQVG